MAGGRELGIKLFLWACYIIIYNWGVSCAFLRTSRFCWTKNAGVYGPSYPSGNCCRAIPMFLNCRSLGAGGDYIFWLIVSAVYSSVLWGILAKQKDLWMLEIQKEYNSLAPIPSCRKFHSIQKKEVELTCAPHDLGMTWGHSGSRCNLE